MNNDFNANPSGNQNQYVPDPADVEKNKVMAGLAYILFFLSPIACPDSKYGKVHAN